MLLPGRLMESGICDAHFKLIIDQIQFMNGRETCKLCIRAGLVPASIWRPNSSSFLQANPFSEKYMHNE